MEQAERTSVISMDRAPAEERSKRLERVHRQVSRGEYVIDPQTVAAAMLERIGATFSEDGVIKESRGGHALMRALTFPREA